MAVEDLAILSLVGLEIVFWDLGTGIKLEKISS